MKLQISSSQKKLYFRRFIRKKFAVFFSLHKVIHISNLVVAYTLIVSPLKLFSQSDTVSNTVTINLEEVEVVGQISPLLSEELSHYIAVTLLTDIECVPSQSLTDLLRYGSNVDIRQRGKNGIQSDISIRGGSFDHSLILLNGVNVSDPQTGHLSLNLPVERDAIARIEILNGPGAQILGANAFSGAINFITASSDTNRLLIASSMGEYGYFSGSLTLNVANQRVKNLLHINNAFSSGYYKNTDFRKQGIYYRGEVESNGSLYNFQMGYSTRAFGANGYYTPRFPDQYEENEMYLFSFDFETGKKTILNARTYWRRHIDRFELFREGDKWYQIQDSVTISNNPGYTQFDTIPWYRHHNHHINDVFGVQLALHRKTRMGMSRLVWHLRSENIISTNIGYDKGIAVPVAQYDGVFYTLSDNRSNFDMQFEQTTNLHPFYLTGAVLINWNSYLPDKLTLYPGMDFRFYLLTNTYLFGSYNYSQGLPTFTDLTYEDPNNLGNNELKPYSQHAFGSGLRYLNRTTNFSLSYFYQLGKDVIDWVWFEDISRFSPINVKNYTSKGVEFTGMFDVIDVLFLKHILSKIRINYTYIDMHKEIPGNVTKYFNVRHKASAMLQKDFLKIITIACNISYTDREGYYLLYNFENNEYVKHNFKPYWLTDIRLSCQLKGFTLYAEATNILDTDYIDIGSINQPGRWITGGINYMLSGF